MARLGRSRPARPVLTRTRSRELSATLAGTLTLSATLTKHTTTAATLGAAAGLSATSSVVRPEVGPPPRPRPRWELVAGPASGGHTMSLTAATGRKVTFRLKDNHEVTFTLDGRHSEAAELAELSTDVHVLWTPPSSSRAQILTRCRVGGTGDDLTDTEHRMAVSCLDYRAVLGRRELREDSTLTYTDTEQAEIAWGLVTDTQSRPGGHLGISKGWTTETLTGVDRTVEYQAGDAIGPRITELGEAVDGYDWDITPTSPSALRMDIWHPERGIDRGVILEYGGLITTARREVDVSQYANAIRHTGADGLSAVEIEEPGIVAVPQGRWDKTYGDVTLNTQGMLDARAAWQLEQAQVIRPTWTVTLRQGGWEGPDHIWLGDPVRLIVKSGRLNVDTLDQRVYEIEIDIGDHGGETVTLTLGGPRPDYRRQPRQTDRRLNNLERR